jgi:hypothetical protein
MFSNDSRHLPGCGDFGIIVGPMMHVRLVEANKYIECALCRRGVSQWQVKLYPFKREQELTE